MALNAAMSVQDGSTAAVSVANGAAINVTPGNQVTFSVTTPGTATTFQFRVDRTDNLGLAGSQSGPSSSSSFVVTMPLEPCTLVVSCEASDGNNTVVATALVKCLPAGAIGQVHRARMATFAALAAYTAAGGVLTANANGALGTIDGVAPVVGDEILLTLGAAGADNGLYVVTSLGGASAKWTMARAPDWQSGFVLTEGQVVEVGSAGTNYPNTTWKVTTAGAITVDTTSVVITPRVVKGSAALVAGTFTIAAPILSTTLTTVSLQRIVANTCTATTGGYCPTVAGANGLTAGVQGTGNAVVQACVAAGTINVADISTLNWMVTNW